MTVPAGGWVLWAGTLGFETPVLERLDAARHLDVQRFSVTPLDLDPEVGARIGPAELGRRIRDAGYDVVLDPIVGWYGGTPHPGSRFGRYSTDQTLIWAEQLGAVAVNLIGQSVHDVSMETLVGAFGAVCDRAAGFGAQAHLEFTPITAITDLASGWDIVRHADRTNGGLLFDTWHFFRSVPDLVLLEQIPGDRIFSVQVSDALAATGELDIRQDTQRRLLPGHGQLDLNSALQVLARTGGLSWVGPEVIAPEMAAMPPVESARLADHAVRQLVAGLRPSALGEEA